MKIVAVTAIPITHPHHEGPSPQYLHDWPINHLFVKIETDEGVIGYGEACDNYGFSNPLTGRALIEEALAPLLLGENPGDIDRLVAKMQGWNRRELGDHGILFHTISALEIALWDIVGKGQGQSVSWLLGRFRDKVPIYASGTVLQEGPPEWHLKLFEPCLSRGVRAVKVRLGLDYAAGLKVLRGFRALIGDDIHIMVDGSEHFSLTTALDIAKALADVNVRWFEEPIPHTSRVGIEQLVERSPVPIAYGERLCTTHDFQDWLMHRRAQVVQPDAATCGGMAEARKIATLAESFGVWVVPHSAAGPLALVANLHVCASAANARMLEYAFTLDRLYRELLRDPILSPERIVDGCLPVPEGPGLGLSVNEEVWTRHPYRPRAVTLDMPSWSLGRV